MNEEGRDQNRTQSEREKERIDVFLATLVIVKYVLSYV